MNIKKYTKQGSRIKLAALALFLGSFAAFAGDAAMQVSNARIRILPGDLPLAGYFDVRNSGKQAVNLTGASSPVFGGVMMHRSMHKDGMASMMMVDNIKIEPGKSIQFAPGGYHLMLMHRKKELKVGDTVAIKLEFSKGPSITAQFRVSEADLQ